MGNQNTKTTESAESNEIKSYKRLFELKKQIPTFKKGSKNDYTNSHYTDLNTILEGLEPLLQNHGFLLINHFEENILEVCLLDLETEFRHTNSIEISKNENPQKIGSQLTYYRRYLLACLLSLKTEDDDGNGNPKQKKEAKEINGANGSNYNPLTKKEINTVHGKVIAATDLEMLQDLYAEDSRYATNKEVKQLFVQQKHKLKNSI